MEIFTAEGKVISMCLMLLPLHKYSLLLPSSQRDFCCHLFLFLPLTQHFNRRQFWILKFLLLANFPEDLLACLPSTATMIWRKAVTAHEVKTDFLFLRLGEIDCTLIADFMHMAWPFPSALELLKLPTQSP